MMRLILQLGLVLLAAACVHCETVFQRPPGPGPDRDYRDDPIYELGQEIDLIWEMDFEEASIVIWQQDVDKIFGDKSYYAEVIQNTKSTRYTWKVTYDGFSVDHDPTLSNVYFFQLFDTAGNATPITCHYFNITDPKTTSITSAATTSATRTVLEIFTTRTSSVTAEKAATTSQVEDNGDNGEKGLSSGAIAGIAVGAGIGGILLGGLGFLLWRRVRGGGGPKTLGSPDDDKEVVSVSSPLVDPYHHPGHQSYYQPQAQEEPEQPQERQIGGLHEAPTERYT